MASNLRQRGFSLIEIMVGVAIGMIGIVVIFQSLAVWESRKRTTSSGSDAQIAGTIAMFNLERDIRQGGFGFGMASAMGCTVSAYDSTRGTPAFTFGLSPVQIVNGGSGAPDEIRVLHGNSALFTAGQPYTQSTATTKKLQGGRAAFQVNDLALITGNTPASCALVQITGNANPDALTLDHATGVRYNPAAGTGTTFSAGTMFNMGPSPQRNIWQIRSGNVLSWSDDLHASTTWFDVAEGIVNLQAEYGVDGSNANPVDNQIGATEWTTTTPTDWTKVRAIRVALLARSQQFEKDLVTANVPAWADGANTFTMTNLDGTAGTTTPTDPAMDWKHYRYRVYEQVIPLRNMIWGTAP